MFSTQLKKLRHQNDVSQRELAAKLSVSQQTVAKWETEGSTPNPTTLTRICDIFNVTSDYLLGRDETPVRKKTQDEVVKFALFGTTEIDDDLLADVKRLAILQKQLREEKRRDGK